MAAHIKGDYPAASRPLCKNKPPIASETTPADRGGWQACRHAPTIQTAASGGDAEGSRTAAWVSAAVFGHVGWALPGREDAIRQAKRTAHAARSIPGSRTGSPSMSVTSDAIMIVTMGDVSPLVLWRWNEPGGVLVRHLDPLNDLPRDQTSWPSH